MKHGKSKYLWEASKGLRASILLYTLAGFAGTAFSLAFIWTSKIVIDIATGTSSGSLASAAVITVILLILQMLCGAIGIWIYNRMQADMSNSLRAKMFAKLLRSSWNEVETFHSGDVINRIEQDVPSVVNLLTSIIPTAAITFVQLVAAFVFFCFLDSSLPWLIVAIMPAVLLGSRFYVKKMKGYTGDIRKKDSMIQSLIQESIQHRTVIKTLGQEERRAGGLVDLQHILRGLIMNRTRFSLLARIAVSIAFSSGYLVAFLWGAVRLSTGSITFGTMTAFLQLVGKIQRPALDISRLVPSFVNALTSVERLQELEKVPDEPIGNNIMFSETPDIEMNDVSFSYKGRKKPVLEHFTCKFPAGSCTAVMGETGRGKTTLLRLLLALASPTNGCINIIPRNASSSGSSSVIPATCIASAQTRCNFVYVPQGNTLFSGTIRENLLMGNPSATEEQMRNALETAVAGFVLNLPKGIDTQLNEQGGGLSEGQAQRIAIARAFLRSGSIMLFDEATSALDSETETQLMKNLKENFSGKTLIFATHHSAISDQMANIHL